MSNGICNGAKGLSSFAFAEAKIRILTDGVYERGREMKRHWGSDLGRCLEAAYKMRFKAPPKRMTDDGGRTFEKGRNTW